MKEKGKYSDQGWNYKPYKERNGVGEWTIKEMLAVADL